MSECIKIENVQGNQILVWSEIEQAFINVTPSESLLNVERMTHQALSPNANIIHGINNNVLQSKGIVAGENVTITDNGTDLIIDVDIDPSTDAETLSGFTHNDFVKRENLNQLVDIAAIEARLDVYNKDAMHDQFMETNASNIPDLDNAYDLGANGRRYADIYATTLHGTATNATIANTIRKNNANEYDVLTWKDNEWRPLPAGSVQLTSIEDVNVNDVENQNVLMYNSDLKVWESKSILDIIPTTSMDFANTGYGEELYINTVENTARFRSIVANDGILLLSDENSVYLSTDDDHTDDLINTKLSEIDIDALENIFTIDKTSNNTMLVWEDGVVVNKPIPVGGGGSGGAIDTTNASEGQFLGFDGTNLVFTETPDALLDISTVNAQDGYYVAFNGVDYELRELTDTDSLLDVDTSTATNGDVLVWDGTKYVLQSVNDLDSIDTENVENGYVVTYEAGEFVLAEPVNIGLTLDDLDTTTASDGFYVAYNGVGYELREMVADSEDNDLLSNVDTTTANDGDVLVWNGVEYALETITSLDDVDVSGAENGQVVAFENGEFVLQDQATITGTLDDIEVTNADVGDSVVWNGIDYELKTITDTLGEVPTTSASDGYYVAFNGTGYELRELSSSGAGEANTDMLRDVSTTTASNGDILVWDGSNYVLQDVKTLGDIDTSGAVDGFILSYTNGEFKLVEISDTLADVDTSTATGTEFLKWNGSEYVLQDVQTLDDIDDSGAAVDDVIVWQGGSYKLKTVNVNDTLGDVSTVGAEDGYFVAYNGSGYELRELASGGAGEANTDMLRDVPTTGATSGDILTWNGTGYELQTVDVTDTLGDVDTSGTTGNEFLKWNGASYVLESIDATDTLGDVSTVSASSGDVLIWNGSSYELSSITDNDTLGDVDVSTASDGDYVAYNTTNGSFEVRKYVGLDTVDTDTATDGDALVWNGSGYEFRELSGGGEANTDMLSDVSTAGAVNGDVLSWNGTGYELTTVSDNDTLGDVDTSTASDGDVLAWNGVDYELRAVTGGDGVTTLEGLTDVDETIVANDGDVLTYNSSKSQYEPAPIAAVGGSGSTKYEIMKINYDVSNKFVDAEYLTDGIVVSNIIDRDLTDLEVTFTGYSFPPISIGYWGYAYDQNEYHYTAITDAINKMSVVSGGVSGAPDLFDPNRVNKEFTLGLTGRPAETGSVESSGFPPEPTHAYVVFVMGE